MQDLIAIKCVFGQETKMLHVQPNIALQKLKNKIVAKLRLGDANVTIKYKDLEGDYVTIRCEDDFKFAVLGIGMSTWMNLYIYETK